MANKEKQLEILNLMLKVGRVEECLLDIFAQGKIPGFIHVGIGQEAVAAGVCSCLQPDDFISDYYT
jgi:TPP-dependent pyruvate/acetoin dehydrogenase alpha subunit